MNFTNSFIPLRSSLQKKPTTTKNSKMYHYSNLKDFKLISSGLTSEVFLAKTKQNTNCVIKVFKSDYDKEYQKEIFFFSKLPPCSNIVSILHSGVVRNPEHTFFTHNYIVMEYADDGDLMNYLSIKGHLQEYEAKKIMLKIVEGIEKVHLNGFIHRDIKPENILMFKDSRVKITDFGLSDEQNIYSNERNGTKNYMAPELYSNGRSITEKVDIFSMGVIAFIMVVGKFPFDKAVSSDRLFSKIQKREWRSFWNAFQCDILNLSISFKKFIQESLCADPEKRFTLKEMKNSFWIKN